jgi:hypothetical protein
MGIKIGAEVKIEEKRYARIKIINNEI